MKAKLTLSIDEEIIATAKEAAKEAGVSLSQIIENHLRLMLNKRNKSKVDENELSITEKLRGFAKLDDDRDYKEIIAEGKMNDYLKLK